MVIIIHGGFWEGGKKLPAKDTKSFTPSGKKIVIWLVK